MAVLQPVNQEYCKGYESGYNDESAIYKSSTGGTNINLLLVAIAIFMLGIMPSVYSHTAYYLRSSVGDDLVSQLKILGITVS
jgi:hypothetical protein